MGRRKSTIVVSARLSDTRPHDRIAMAHIEASRQAGLPLQGVIVDALCKAAGTDVRHFDSERVAPQSAYIISAFREQLEAMQANLLEGFGQLLMDELKRLNVISSAKHSELTRRGGEDSNSSFLQGLAKSYASKIKGDE